VRIAVDTRAEGQVAVVALSVEDSGVGMDDATQKKLFQPFIQIDSALNRKYEGTGLGLALVKRIIELHGGTVSVSSQVGTGSCFTIHLPCEELDLVLPSKPVSPNFFNLDHSAQPSTERSPLILLADDNEANTRSFSSYLTVKGFRIILANNGQEAIQLTQESLPDLILMDIQLPEISGLDVTKLIKADESLRGIPIIAVTAFAMKDDEEKILAAGCQAYISKPISIVPFLNTVRRFLGEEEVL
jgi:CheY-like chemotaxis protein